MMRDALRALLHIVLAIGILAAAVGAFRLAILPGLEALLGLEGVVLTSVRRTGTVGCLVLGYALYARRVARRPVSDLGLRWLPIVGASLAGAALVGVPMLMLYAIGSYQVTAIRGFGAVAGVTSLILGAAVFEEVLFRGVLFRIGERYFGTVAALIVQSVFFSTLHVFNGNFGVVSVVSGAVIGAMWTLIYLLSKNIWVASLNHAAWNFAIFSAGLPLSGLHQWRALAPIQSEYGGPVLLSGGADGPEGSVLVVVFGMAAVAGLWSWARDAGCLVRSGGSPLAVSP